MSRSDDSQRVPLPGQQAAQTSGEDAAAMTGAGHFGMNDIFLRVISALRAVPGSTECIVFGSWATGRADEHSDLDLTLLTQNVGAAAEAVIAIANAEVALDLVWTIRTGSAPAWVLVTRAGSVAHRVDIGIVADAGQQQLPSSHCAWKQLAAPRNELSLPTTRALRPLVGSDAHSLWGQLIGATRYVKARYRGNEEECA